MPQVFFPAQIFSKKLLPSFTEIGHGCCVPSSFQIFADAGKPVNCLLYTSSINAYNTLKDWGMQILCGTVTTQPCIAVSVSYTHLDVYKRQCNG